jgi:hypothetical protein
MHSLARINFFPAWKQLSSACTCLQALSWSSQELLPPRSLTHVHQSLAHLQEGKLILEDCR